MSGGNVSKVSVGKNKPDYYYLLAALEDAEEWISGKLEELGIDSDKDTVALVLRDVIRRANDK